MELLSCPVCAESNLVFEDGFWHCKICGATLKEEEKHSIEEILQKQMELGEGIDLGRLRALLREELSAEFVDRKAVLSYCRDILKVMPEDKKAMFLLRFYDRKNNRRLYHNFLKKLSAEHLTDHEKRFIFPLLIHEMEYEDQATVRDFLRAQGDLEENEGTIRAALAQRERENDLFASVPRDIFICHAHSDIARILPLMKRLEEEEGFTLWYSERNLPKDIDNYRNGIEEAIRQCSMFIVFASRAAMLSKDVQWEMSVAEKLGKKLRLEYRLEPVENSIKFRYFFEGLQWIDASEEEKGDDLIERTYLLLEQYQLENGVEVVVEPVEEKHVSPAQDIIDEADKEFRQRNYYDAMEKYLQAQQIVGFEDDALNRSIESCRDAIYDYEAAFKDRYEQALHLLPESAKAIIDEANVVKKRHVALSLDLRRCKAFEDFLEMIAPKKPEPSPIPTPKPSSPTRPTSSPRPASGTASSKATQTAARPAQSPRPTYASSSPKPAQKPIQSTNKPARPTGVSMSEATKKKAITAAIVGVALTAIVFPVGIVYFIGYGIWLLKNKNK